MSESTVAVRLPKLTYRKLQRAAELTYRTVDDILASAVESSLPTIADVPPELAEELTALHLFSDEALWAATKPIFSPAEQARLSQLNQTAGERGERDLTAVEIAEQETLLAAYHRSVLRRAQALAILSQRGHAVTLDDLPLPVSP